MKLRSCLLLVTLTMAANAAAGEEQISSAIPLKDIAQIHEHFADPQNTAQILIASENTQFVWQNMSRFFPTALVPRAGAVSVLPEALDESVGDIEVTFADGRTSTVDAFIADNPVDALLVIRDGRIVYERYETMRPFDRHNWFSSGKVIGATLLAMLEDEGLADLSQPVSSFIEELEGSVWDTVPLRLAANMATGLDGTEHDEPNGDSRTNPDQIWYRAMSSMGVYPPIDPMPASAWEVLRTMQQRRAPETAFEYNSINTLVVDVAVERITGRPLNEVFSERVWRKIGAEGDGYYVVSTAGEPLTFGLFSSTLRDFARFGMIFTPSWRVVSDDQIVSDEMLARIQANGRPEAFRDGYAVPAMQRNFPGVEGLTNAYQWDAILPDGDLFKAGVGGQGLYVSPSRDTVVVYFMTGDGSEGAATVARAITTGLR